MDGKTKLAVAACAGAAGLLWAAVGARKRQRVEESECTDKAELSAAKKLVAKMLCEGCVIGDVDGLTRKLERVICGGGDELSVIADFDRTLTSAASASAHGVVAKVLPESFIEFEKELFAHYYPIEKDLSIPIPEKIPIMREWYGKNHSRTLQGHKRGLRCHFDLSLEGSLVSGSPRT